MEGEGERGGQRGKKKRVAVRKNIHTALRINPLQKGGGVGQSPTSQSAKILL